MRGPAPRLERPDRASLRQRSPRPPALRRRGRTLQRHRLRRTPTTNPSRKWRERSPLPYTLIAGSPTLYSYASNVDHVRARGVELVLESRDVLIRGFEFSGSVTYLDAKTLALSGRASATASADAAIGKKLPNIPDWRASVVLTYRPDQRWAFTVAGRYSDKLWTTLDNTDVNPNTWQGFAPFFVADTHINARLTPHWNASLGVDNFLNRKYFLFHPFPQRTVVANLKYAF